MKAILVIDMPTKCWDCPLFTYDSDFYSEYGFCDDRNKLKLKEGGEKIRFDEKPTWCPLRPLPDKKMPKANEMFPQDMRLVDRWKGWDACLKEITGETE